MQHAGVDFLLVNLTTENRDCLAVVFDKLEAYPTRIERNWGYCNGVIVRLATTLFAAFT